MSQKSYRNLTVRCSRPLYSSQPTHPHPPKTPRNGTLDGPGNPGRTAPEPRQHATPTRTKHAKGGHPPTSRPPRPQQPQQPTRAGVSPMPAPDKPTTPHTSARRSAARPSARSSPGRPRPIQRPRQQRPGSHPHTTSILRKEVIQPHLPVRLPCYDFVPITSPTFDRSP